jgi:hypothetical protein
VGIRRILTAILNVVSGNFVLGPFSFQVEVPPSNQKIGGLFFFFRNVSVNFAERNSIKKK